MGVWSERSTVSSEAADVVFQYRTPKLSNPYSDYRVEILTLPYSSYHLTLPATKYFITGPARR